MYWLHCFSFLIDDASRWRTVIDLWNLTLPLFKLFNESVWSKPQQKTLAPEQPSVTSATPQGKIVTRYRYAKANNKYVPEQFIDAEQSSYLMYRGVNNLYGTAMCSTLLYGGFKRVDSYSFNLLNIPDSNEEDGYVEPQFLDHHLPKFRCELATQIMRFNAVLFHFFAVLWISGFSE